jgi:hypothetical protein
MIKRTLTTTQSSNQTTCGVFTHKTKQNKTKISRIHKRKQKSLAPPIYLFVDDGELLARLAEPHAELGHVVVHRVERLGLDEERVHGDRGLLLRLADHLARPVDAHHGLLLQRLRVQDLALLGVLKELLRARPPPGSE